MLRLDFNENTIGPSPKVVEAIRAIPAEHYAIYPEYAGLAEKFAESVRCKPDQVGLFNGADAAIQAVFLAFASPGDKLLTTRPTFGYYNPCAKQREMVIEELDYVGDNFDFPMEAMRTALQQRPRILMICNPNNPTGTRLAPELVRELASSAPETLVVVDELYEAFTGDSVLPSSVELPNLVVLRSLAKTAGLAGLRMGFAVGDAAVINRLGRVTGPYDINSFGVTAAFAALDDQAYTDTFVKEVVDAKAWLTEQLKSAGIRHVSSGGNYLLFWPEEGPVACEKRLREGGILVRSQAGKPLIDGSIRVSVGNRAQMERFWKLLRGC